MKKTISLFIAFCLIISTVMVSSTNVFAASTQTSLSSGTTNSDDSITSSDIANSKTMIRDLLTMLISDPSYYGITEPVESLCLGKSFQFANYDASRSITFSDNIRYFPVCSGKTIVAILSMCKYEGEISCTIGKDYAEKLNNLLNSGIESLAFVDDNQTLYMVDSSNVAYLIGSYNIKIKTVPSDKVINKYKYSQVGQSKSQVSRKTSTEYNDNTLSGFAVDSSLIKSQSVATVTTVTKNLAVPNVGQYVNGVMKNICWASTMASIVRYKRPATYPSLTGQQVCDYLGVGYDNGQDWPVITLGYTHYLGTSYSVYSVVNSALSMSDIISRIDAGNPSAMSSSSTSGTQYHHTVLCGYSYKSDGSSKSITIMNPGEGGTAGGKQTATYGSAGKFTFTYGGFVYIWNATLNII